MKREALHARDATRAPLTFHDLRATGITWRCVRGDEVARIQQCAGHEALDTTMAYVREAQTFAHGFGRVFPKLPPRLGSATRIATGGVRRAVSSEDSRVPAVGVEPAATATPRDTSRLLARIGEGRVHRVSRRGRRGTGYATGGSDWMRGDVAALDAIERWGLGASGAG